MALAIAAIFEENSQEALFHLQRQRLWAGMCTIGWPSMLLPSQSPVLKYSGGQRGWILGHLLQEWEVLRCMGRAPLADHLTGLTL